MKRRQRRQTFMQEAVDQWRACRQEFEDYRHAAYVRAVNEIDGSLLNRAGKRAHIDPYSLFMGNEARARAYASEELLEHWETHARPVFARFESQSVINLRAEMQHA